MKYYKKIKSPVGLLTLVATNSHLISILWQATTSAQEESAWTLSETHKILKLTERQLKEYFEGRRQKFDIPTQTQGTEFQEKVWRALRKIRFGETWSYKKLASAIGNPNASRAVGAANAKNPLSIVVPCHRVIGAHGSLTGFAGGLEAKAILLNHEKG